MHMKKRDRNSKAAHEHDKGHTYIIGYINNFIGVETDTIFFLFACQRIQLFTILKIHFG